MQQVGKHLPGLVVGGIFRQGLQILFQLQQQFQNVLALLHVDVGEQVDGRAGRNGTDLYPIVPKQPGQPAAQCALQGLQEVGQVTSYNFV